MKKICIRIIRNINNGGGNIKNNGNIGGMGGKAKSEYIPTTMMLAMSNVNGYGI